MLLALAILLLVGVVKVAADYRARVVADDDIPAARRGFFLWMAKGIAFPLFVWIFLNCGVLSRFPPIVPEISLAGPQWPLVLLGTIPAALFFIASWWTAITVGWFMVLLLAEIPPANHKDALTACLGWSALAGPVAFVIVWIGGWATLGLALAAWFLPITYVMLFSINVETPVPSYSNAIAKIKFGKYDEAESEVIRQLEKCENDFDGWMMLAELYATHFNDMPSAQQTILDLCEQPNINGSQVSVALHRLADWHLINEDPARARRALEEICERLPDTHLDRMARLRIAQLPATREELRERKTPKPIRIPHFGPAEDQP